MNGMNGCAMRVNVSLDEINLNSSNSVCYNNMRSG